MSNRTAPSIPGHSTTPASVLTPEESFRYGFLAAAMSAALDPGRYTGHIAAARLTGLLPPAAVAELHQATQAILAKYDTPEKGCAPWCPGGHGPDVVCHAPAQPAPTDPGCRGGEVTLGFDSDAGPLIYLRCKVEDLTPAEARQLAHALNAQAEAALRDGGCPWWCIADHEGEVPGEISHYSQTVSTALSFNHSGPLDVCLDQWDDREPRVVLTFVDKGPGGEVYLDADRTMNLAEAVQHAQAVLGLVRVAVTGAAA